MAASRHHMPASCLGNYHYNNKDDDNNNHDYQERATIAAEFESRSHAVGCPQTSAKCSKTSGQQECIEIARGCFQEEDGR